MLHKDNDDEEWVPHRRKHKPKKASKRKVAVIKEDGTRDTDSKSSKDSPVSPPSKVKAKAKRQRRSGRCSRFTGPIAEESKKLPKRISKKVGDGSRIVVFGGALGNSMRNGRKRRHPESKTDHSVVPDTTVAPAVGITNFGTNCYANSGIQYLLCVPELNSYFLQEGFEAHVHNEQSIKFCKAVAEIYKKIFNTEKVTKISPKSLTDLCPSVQSDTHEFFIKKLFPSLSEDPKGEPQSAQHSAMHKKGILESLFGGEMASKVVCKTCLNESIKHDAFLDISLAITGKTLEECLEQYFSEEELAIREAYFCGKCENLSAATKTVLISQCPKYLILHLKRLMPGERKIARFIKFPKELEMGKFTVDKSEVKYELIAVCVHTGGGKSGHYFTFGKRADQWYMFNDQLVFKKYENEVLKQEAYMLLYAKYGDS